MQCVLLAASDAGIIAGQQHGKQSLSSCLASNTKVAFMMLSNHEG
jgi:hypothetical protein